MTPFFGGVLLLAACGGLVPTHGAVIELDDNSFYNYAKDRDVLLVDFYAPWCSDCKNLEPDFQAAGASLGARSIDLAKVDCFGAGKGLCTKYGVKQWPTLKNFNRGTYTGDYTGGLSAGEIAGYVNTVENSVSSQVVSNPYAAPYTPMVMQTQQCVSRCKISKITNKAPCYAKCKAPKPAVRKMLPQPVINEKSCAKCRQPQIAGKFRHLCSPAVERACDQLLMSNINIWKKFEKPRFQPSIAPDLFNHQEKAMVAPLIGRVRPVVNAFARNPQNRYALANQLRPSNLLSSFTKLGPPQAAPQHPWTAVMADVHAKDTNLLRPSFISPHRAEMMENAAFASRNKESVTSGVAVEEPSFKLPETKGTVKLPVEDTAKFSEMKPAVKLPVENPTKLEETKPAVKLPVEDTTKLSESKPAVKLPVEDTTKLPESKPAVKLPVEDTTKLLDTKPAVKLPADTESATVVGVQGLKASEGLKSTDGGEENLFSNNSVSADMNLINRGEDKYENAQQKKNINNELSSVAPTGDSSNADPLKSTASNSKPSGTEQNEGEANNPQPSSQVVSENPIKYGSSAGADAKVIEQPKLPLNETTDVANNAEAAPQSPPAPAADKVTDAGAKDVVDSSATSNLFTNGSSSSTDKLESADARTIDKLLPSTNTSLESENTAPNNGSVVTPDVGKKDEAKSSDDKSISVNGTTSLKEMDFIESEINHGTAAAAMEPQLPENGTAEVRKASTTIFPEASAQLDTIDSIESQFKNGDLADETSQLKVNGKELDTLPSDVVAKLPYTRDDKKETIPTNVLDQQEVDIFTRDRF